MGAVVKEEVVLLNFWVSPSGIRVRIALEEKGIEYEYLEEKDLYDKSPLLLEMNPVHKKVPVLIHNGEPVCESLLILEYIDEVWKHKPPFLPSDPYLRSQARFWAKYIDDKLYPPGLKILCGGEEEQEASREEFIGVLRVMEVELGDKPYFGGDTFGYLDATFISFYCYLSSYELYGKFSTIEECPRLAPWISRCLEKKAVAKSTPDPNKVNHFVSYHRKLIGVDK